VTAASLAATACHRHLPLLPACRRRTRSHVCYPASAPVPRSPFGRCILSQAAALHGGAAGGSVTEGTLESARSGRAKEQLGVYVSANAKQLGLPVTLGELKGVRKLVGVDQRLYSWAHEVFWQRVECAERAHDVRMVC